MKKKFFGILLLVLLISSCQSNANASDTDIPTEKEAISENPTSTTIETSSASEALPIGVVEGEYGLAYESDIEIYGSRIAATVYEWRTNGNPDLLSAECVPYNNNEAGFSIVPLQNVYSLQDTQAQWGVDVVSISDDIEVLDHSEALNLEKKVNGKWVRQTILDIGRLFEAESKPLSYYVFRKETVLNSIFTIPFDKVDPKIEAGEYRFIFYVKVESNEKQEYRKYYVPFTVTE